MVISGLLAVSVISGRNTTYVLHSSEILALVKMFIGPVFGIGITGFWYVVPSTVLKAIVGMKFNWGVRHFLMQLLLVFGHGAICILPL